MRLDFNVLWVEDQPNSVQAISERIGVLIRKEGFRVQVVFAKSVKEALGLLADDIYGDHIDLILMDYDLGAGEKGDEGLVDVRKEFRFKDIVFYSAGAADLSAMVAKRKIQGVFCSDREGLADTVEGVFEALVKKVIDIDHARGIIMGSASDIDGLVLDCLLAYFANDEGALSEHARKAISDRLKEIRSRFDKELAGAAAATKIAQLFAFYGVYTSIDRLHLLRKILDAGGKHVQACEAIKSYALDTVPKRNILAHVRVVQQGFSRKLYDKKGNELTNVDVKNLRHALLQHQELLEDLVNQLTPS